jgi:hypothetical protein
MNLQPKGKSRIPEPERSRFYTARGWLKLWGLACGYVHEHNTAVGDDGCITTRMWAEHGAVHVRQHDHAKGERVLWDTFIVSEGPGQLAAARRRMMEAIKDAERERA